MARPKGFKCSGETKRRMSESHKGIVFTKEHRGNISRVRIGKTPSKETRLKMSETRKRLYREGKIKLYSPWLGKHGEEVPSWKHGKTKEVSLMRKRPWYTQWRTSVFERDSYTCQECNQLGGTLNAHHIKHFTICVSEKDFKTLRDINNGITLCGECHNKKHLKEYWGNQYDG